MTQTTTTTHDHPEWVLMAKALRGELSEQEQEEFSQWLNADETHALLWAEASDTWDKTGCVYDASFNPDASQAWENFCSSVSFEPAQNAPIQISIDKAETEVKPLFAWSQFLRYAAIFLLAVGLGWIGFQQFNASNDWSQIATVSGERKLVYLPDSSMVTLNGNSSLKYQASFSGDTREVELSGEAFFEVKENPSQPFIITSGQAVTKVLGTSFNLLAQRGSKEVAVSVVTGKVSLASLEAQQEIILTPGFTGKLLPTGKLAKVETTATENPSWKTLSFENTSLKEVSVQLSTFFGVAVDLSNPSLQNCSFTGTFENPNLKEILKVLAASSDVTIKQSAPNNYTISGPGCR